jgi:MOSC domain-containing protein YiiM
MMAQGWDNSLAPLARSEGLRGAADRFTHSKEGAMGGVVVAVSRSAKHTMSKPNEESIRLLEGLGVEGDAHSGATVKHRSRIRLNAHRPNLRQVHLIHAELHDELREAGFRISAGEMGENVTTRGVDLLGLPSGARLHLGSTAVVEVTGLRNPCRQLNGIARGLMATTLGRDEDGTLVRKAGIMGVVIEGGEVRPGDQVRVELPPPPHRALAPV